MADPQRSSRRPLASNALARLVQRLNRASAAPWLHGEVARRMAERLPVIKLQPQTAADWGAFLGGSAQLLAQTYPDARLLAVEPDAARRDRTAAALARPWWSPQRWRGAAPLAMTASDVAAGQAQLLWSNMGLHFEADPQATMAAWHRATAVDGFLMFSTLGPGSLGSLRALYAAQGWPEPFAPFVDMHDLGDMLIEAGFADPVMDQETITLTWPTAEALLAELRQLGSNVSLQRAPGLRTPRWRQQLLRALEAGRDAQGRLGLEFEIVYGHAFRPPPRPRLAARTEIALEDLRTMARTRPRPA